MFTCLYLIKLYYLKSILIKYIIKIKEIQMFDNKQNYSKMSKLIPKIG